MIIDQFELQYPKITVTNHERLPLDVRVALEDGVEQVERRSLALRSDSLQLRFLKVCFHKKYREASYLFA